MNRRHVLRSVSALGSASLAGCTSVFDSHESETVLGRVEIINSSFASNSIRIVVKRGTKTLVDRNFALEALDSEGGAGWTVIEPSWSHSQGRYTVRAAHIDESGGLESEYRSYTFTQEDYGTYYDEISEDPGCIGAAVRIGSLTDHENAPIGISPTYMETPCRSIADDRTGTME